MAKVYQSACPLNCWDSCGFHVTVEDGKVVKVEGDPNHPITKGNICGRGRMLASRTNAADRLLYPLKKINEEFVQISWEQALDEIAEKMKSLKETYGSASVLHSHDYANSGLLTNLDARFFNYFGGATELVGSLCWGSGIEAQSWDFGDAFSHAPEDVKNSRNIVIWGRNVARTNMHFFQNLQQAKKHGARLYVIDPIYNATAKIADQYISIKPGMDGFLAAGIIKEMLRLGLEDRGFIKDCTFGFEDAVEELSRISLAQISEITEVPVETITCLAHIYADRPTSTFFGLGMQRYENGGSIVRWIDALAAVSGNIGIPGGGANYANKQVGQSFNITGLTEPDKKTSFRQFTMMKQAEEILTAKLPEIKMIIVTCGNPLTQVPDTNTVRKAFESVETLVVIEQFMTDTAELADYVLPAAAVFEEEDLYYSSMYHHYVNYAPKLVNAPGEAKSDLWIWAELAKRLGFGEAFRYTREEWLNIGLEKLNSHGITLEAIKKEGFAELPVDPVPWKNRIFKTKSGKYEFTSSAAAEKGFSGKMTLTFPKESKWSNEGLAKKHPYTLLTIHPMRSNHSQNYHLLQPAPKVKIEVAANIALKLNLEENDFVRVWNDRGEISGYVSILKQAHPDTINIDEGIWRKFGGSVNMLTSSSESDNGQGSTLYDCLVNIDKIR